MTLFKKTLSTLVFVMSVFFAYSQEYKVSDPIPTDKEYKIGKLDNGLTYYIRKSVNPAKRAEFFIVHNVGSLQEDDNQRGLAHFLEHMAFNGTKNFPKKKLLEYFGSIGVKFGANINAYTSMDRTVYNLSAVPMIRTTVIDSALLVLHDWSYYISCEPAEIEAERGVIREEWRRGDDAKTRMMKSINRFEQTGSRFAQRDVIGLPEIINNFTPETLVEYYHKWYRPDLQAIVIVGDFDVADMEKRIIKEFSSIPKANNPVARESYTIPNNTKPIVGYFTDPESKAVSARVTTKIPNLSKEARQTNELFYKELEQYLFLEIFRDRVATAAERADSCFKIAIPVFGSISYASQTFTVTSIPTSNSQTLKAIKGILTEFERIKQHGVQKEELENAVSRVNILIDKNYDRIKNLKSVDYVSAAIENFTRATPLMTPAEYLNTSKECLKRITLEDINSFVRKTITNENRVVIFCMPESEKRLLPSEDEVIKAIEDVSTTETESYIPVRKKGLEFSKKLDPISIMSKRAISGKEIKLPIGKQLDSTVEFILANGSKVIWKEEHKADKKIYLEAFKKGGASLDMDVMDIKLLERFSTSYLVNGLNKQELTKWLSNKTMSLSTSLSYRYSGIGGSCFSKDSVNFFKLLHVYFTDINIDERAVKNFKTQILKNLSESKGSQNIYSDSIKKLRYSYNPYQESFTKDYIKSVTSEKLLNIYRSIYYNPTGFTFVFSGPMSATQAKSLIEKYIATIPIQAGSMESSVALSQLQRSENPIFREPKINSGEIVLRYKGENLLSSKASITRYYHNKFDYNASNYLNAKVFTYILRERYMKSIREERGGTYHVGVSYGLLRYPENLAQITVEFDTDPKLVDDLLGVVQQEIETFAKNGPTDKEINEVKLYLEKTYQDRQKDNFSWTSAISGSLQDNITFEDKEPALLKEVNAKSLKSFANKLLQGKNRMTFVFEPK